MITIDLVSGAVKVKSILNLEIHGHDPLILVIFALIECSVFSVCSQRMEKTAITMLRQCVKCTLGILPTLRQDLKQKQATSSLALTWHHSEHSLGPLVVQKILLDHS